MALVDRHNVNEVLEMDTGPVIPMVILSGYIQVPDSDLDAVLSELPNHIELTRQEKGCISFSVVPDASNPNRFDVYEEFADDQSLEDHQARVKGSVWGSVTTNAARHYEISRRDT